MKLRVDRDALADAVAWTAKSLPARPSVPVLAGALLSVSDGRLNLSGFDYEVSSQVTVDVASDADGSALVSGKLLAEIVKALPAKPVDLAAEGSHIELVCGSARFTLPTMPVEDYPALPQLPDPVGTVDAAAFAAAVAQTAVAAGKDDTLPTMTGIQLEFNGDAMSLQATDRYRAAIRDLPWSPAAPDYTATVLVPAKALSDTAKALGARGGDVTLSLPASDSGGAGMIGLSVAERRTTSRVLDGQLPQLRALLPPVAAQLRVSAAGLSSVVRRVALVAERNSQLRMRYEADELVVEAGGAEDAKASEALECRYSGEAGKIAFNAQYLLDGLSALNAPTAVFAFPATAGKGVVLSGAAESDQDSDQDDAEFSGYKHLLQPLRYDG